MAGVPGTTRHTMSVLRADAASNDESLTAWITEAVDRGEKVVLAHAPGGEGSLRRLLDRSGVPARARDGQLEPADVTTMRGMAGGALERLARLAVGEGWTGLALAEDGTTRVPPMSDVRELAAYEREIDRLTAAGLLRALCRVAPAGCGVPGLFELHHRDVEDDAWSAGVRDGRMWVAGEIDVSNADRVGRVLCAGIAAGLTEVDVSRVRFCAVAGVRTFIAAAARHAPPTQACGLTLVGARPALARALDLVGARVDVRAAPAGAGR